MTVPRFHLGLPATCGGPGAGVCWGVFGAATTGVTPLIEMSLLQIIGGGAGASGCMVIGVHQDVARRQHR